MKRERPHRKTRHGGHPGPRGKVHRKRPHRAPAEAPEPAANPRAHALAKRIGQLLLDKKGVDVVILDVRGRTSYADYMVIASGESDRQVSAMADFVLEELKKESITPIGAEGFETGHWVLLDYGEVVTHLFYTDVRSFYDLEGLWADARREMVA